MSLHFPLPKIRTVRFSFHTSRFSIHGERWSVLWRWNSQWVHTFLCQKIFALFVPPLSNGTSRATSDRKPKTNVQILPSPIIVLPIVKMNQIKSKNYWKLSASQVWKSAQKLTTAAPLTWQACEEKCFRRSTTEKEFSCLTSHRCAQPVEKSTFYRMLRAVRVAMVTAVDATQTSGFRPFWFFFYAVVQILV